MGNYAVGGSTKDAATVSGVPLRTVQYWRAHLEAMSDSELDALIAREKRVAGAVWTTIEHEAQDFVLELRAAGDAKSMQHAATVAGIAHDKTINLGQPRDVTPSHSPENPLLMSPPEKPTE